MISICVAVTQIISCSLWDHVSSAKLLNFMKQHRYYYLLQFIMQMTEKVEEGNPHQAMSKMDRDEVRQGLKHRKWE